MKRQAHRFIPLRVVQWGVSMVSCLIKDGSQYSFDLYVKTFAREPYGIKTSSPLLFSVSDQSVRTLRRERMPWSMSNHLSLRRLVRVSITIVTGSVLIKTSFFVYVEVMSEGNRLAGILTRLEGFCLPPLVRSLCVCVL